jgi:hypothetical protein
MTYDEIPVLYRDTWAVYEALRKLGFKDEQISHLATPVVYPDGTTPEGEHIVVVLTTGDKHCTFIIGKLDRPFDEARDLLERVRNAIANREIDDHTLRRLWETSALAKLENFQSVAAVLLNKGIVLPVSQN